MKYICLGYFDPIAFASLPEAEQQAMLDNCFAYDDQLRTNGHYQVGEGLQPSNTAMTPFALTVLSKFNLLILACA